MARDFEKGEPSDPPPDTSRYNVVRRIARALIESSNLPEAFQALVDITANALGAHLATMAVEDPERAPFAQAASGEKIPNFSPVIEIPTPASNSLTVSWTSIQEDAPAPDRSTWRWIGAPLKFCGRLLGTLKAARLPGEPGFTPADEFLLAAIADQAALAWEAEHQRHMEHHQRRQTQTLQETARILGDSLDLQRLLELILDQMAHVVNYDSASIMLLSGEIMSIAAYRKLNNTEQPAIPNTLNLYPHIRKVIDDRRPVIIGDTLTDQRWQPLAATAYIRSWMGIPLVGREAVIGLLNLDKELPSFFTPADADLVTTFAQQAAIAIENARLYTGERRRADQLDALTATIADISSELELPRLLQAILQRAVSLCQATGGDLGLLDETDGTIHIVASYNLDHDYSGTVQAPGEGAMGRAIQTRRAVNITNYPDFEAASPQYLNMNEKATLSVPFMIGSRFVGAIGIGDANPERRFTPDEERMLGLFAQNAAIAVENARLFQAARTAAERRSALHQVSQAIVGAAMQPAEVYAAIHTAAARLMPAEAFVITRYDHTSGQASAVYMVDKGQQFAGEPYGTKLGLFGRVFVEDRSIYISDLARDSGQDSVTHFGTSENVRSVLAVPMRLRGLVVGMISTQSYQPDSYTSEDLVLLEMLASYAAIALDNATLFQNVQHQAITDPLTGLFNRRQLFDLGQREFVRARRFNRPLSALMVDIDHFKQVNDRYSHAIGDRVLVRLGQVMRRAVREIDIVGRYGGEEFVLILPEADLQTALEIANRLHEQVYETFYQNSLPRITVSIGLASIQQTHNDFNELVHATDLALYAAKGAGRDRIASL